MQHFGWKKQQLSLTAKRENWRRLVISPRVFYHVDDVRVYAVLRLRTTLAAQLGRPAVRGLLRIFRTGEVDTICPTCGGYAFAYGPDGVCGKEHRFRTKQETA